MTTPPTPPADLRCKGCGAFLGRCTPAGLVLGEALRLTHPARWECLSCGRAGKWYPDEPASAPREAARGLRP